MKPYTNTTPQYLPPLNIDAARAIKTIWDAIEKPLKPFIMLAAFIGSSLYITVILSYLIRGQFPPWEEL